MSFELESRHTKFDVSRLRTWPLRDRTSKVHQSDILHPELDPEFQLDRVDPEIVGLAKEILAAHQSSQPIVFFLSGHVIKHGLSRYIIDLMRTRHITHVATNGATMIHDFELTVAGHTSEDVGHYIVDGKFGMWEDTAMLNQLANNAAYDKLGYGERVGKVLCEGYPHRNYSLFQAGWNMNVPITTHTLIGGDILHQHANYRGYASGQASHNDFLIFTQTISEMEYGGVYVNVGSQVTGVEVFLKSLSMARNLRYPQESLKQLTTGMLDFVQLPKDWRNGEASEDDAAYYYRPWKTLLLRVVADGGDSFYICGQHRYTIPTLWQTIRHLGGS